VATSTELDGITELSSDNEFNTELSNKLCYLTESDDFDEGLRVDNYSKTGLQDPPQSPVDDLWDLLHCALSPCNRYSSKVPDSQDNKIIG
jgi:hypothetical protein